MNIGKKIRNACEDTGYGGAYTNESAELFQNRDINVRETGRKPPSQHCGRHKRKSSRRLLQSNKRKITPEKHAVPSVTHLVF